MANMGSSTTRLCAGLQRLGWVCALVAAWGVLLSASQAAAQALPLDEAEAHLQVLQFDAAREAAHRAIDAGGLSAQKLGRAYEIIGLCASTVGNNAEANAAYLRMFALNPDAQPSDMLPPDKNRAFYDAQGFWLSRRDRLGLEVNSDTNKRRVHVSVSDPLGMARTVTLTELNSQTPSLQKPIPAIAHGVDFDLPPRMTAITFAVDLLDGDGNLLAEAQGQLDVIAATVLPPEQGNPGGVVPPPPPPPGHDAAPTSERRWLRSPWLWTAVGVVAVGVGATVGVLATRSDQTTLRSDVSVVGH